MSGEKEIVTHNETQIRENTQMNLQEYEKKHTKFLRENLAECTVLLKKNDQFPLSAPERIALYGSGVRHTIKGGTGSGEVNSRYFVSVEQGLEDAGFEITTKYWLDAYDQIRIDAHKQFIKDIKVDARKKHTLAILEGMGAVMPEPSYDLPLEGEGETAIYVLSRISGEGSDRNPKAGDILLSDTERRDILAINRKYKKFMLVLNVGGPVDLTPVLSVENILVLSQLGVETGNVLADILLGKSNPSGKLATTWSSWKDYSTVGDFGDMNDTYYKEGIYVGYRYFDSIGKRALFPFGFGTSFALFEFDEYECLLNKTEVTVNVMVKNIGKYTGKEVVQVYVSAPQKKMDKAYQDLAAWTKTSNLEPGKFEKVSITFDMKDLASYDTKQAQYVLEQGEYIIRVGNSSVDTLPIAKICLDLDAVVKKVRNTCGDCGFDDWKPECVLSQTSVEGIPVLQLESSLFNTVETIYDTEYDIAPEIDKLNDAQLVYMNVGAFDPKGGLLSVIGNASKSVAGAAGESTDMLKTVGIPTMVMADGPAGLRLSQKYTIDENGIHSLGEGMPASMMELMPTPVKWFMEKSQKNKKIDESKIHYQYATAIPIGTAIAQSWNLDFAKDCGDIVGAEMEMFGVHLWLAPALNIHRSIRCGRNFEYFSEDPVISGKFAAALTKGVQNHPGCGTTIKHYAANSQETNRYNSNSRVSERAMREIYLKGFGICIEEAQPHAVMTSYNLLNGVHTSERRDLIEDVLRSEYGFEGIVMTDWVIFGMSNRKSMYRGAIASETVMAGSNLFMPGSKADYKDVCKALQDGKVTRKQLKINATKTYHMARKLCDKEMQ